jgi:SpoU rRNA methylase family enzyme
MEYNFELFNAITDALEALEAARAILVTAQQNAEEVYINEEHL